MSRYRWLRPSKCIESMQFFEGLQEKNLDELDKLLFDAVKRGDIDARLNDEIVPKAHIAIYLSLYARANPDQGRFTLPPDLALNYDNLCAVLDRPNIDSRRRGRPRKEHSGWSEDRMLAHEMHKMLAGAPGGLTPARSAAEAARILVEQGRVSGPGTKQSRAKRLERIFRKYYSS